MICVFWKYVGNFLSSWNGLSDVCFSLSFKRARVDLFSLCVCFVSKIRFRGKVGVSSLLKPTPRKKPDSHERQNYYNFMYND